MFVRVAPPCYSGLLVVYFAHNLIVGEFGEVGENPTLTRNRERPAWRKSDYQIVDKTTDHPSRFAGRRFFFAIVSTLSFTKGSHV